MTNHISIFVIICSLIIYSQSAGLNCPSPVPSDWTESYCPDDIDRIEYQIPLDDDILTGNSIAEIDDFIQWMRDELENNVYRNYFKIRTDKTRKYYRVVEELEITKTNVAGTNTYLAPPRVSAIKYRKSFGDFKMDNSVHKYKNDLTWENAMTTPGKDLDYKSIKPLPAYSPLFKTKLEANIMIDTCQEGYLALNPPTYGETGTGFSAKISFDDDLAYGSDDTNSLNMIDTSLWTDVPNSYGFYCDSTDPLTPDCICGDVERYFQNYCSYFSDDASETHQEYRFIQGIDYIVDIDFYWYKNGDANDPSNPTHASKGKFTFQVRYASLQDKKKDAVNDASTELSIKLYKSKTKDVLNNWDDLTHFAEQLSDVLTSQDSSSSRWIDHTMCESDTHCCTNYFSTSPTLKNQCTALTTQNLCEKKQTKGVNNCQWIPCEAVGDCVWNGEGSSKSAKKCSKQTTEENCKKTPNCNWEKRSKTGVLVNERGQNKLFRAAAQNEMVTDNVVLNKPNYGYFVLIGMVTLILVSCVRYCKQSKSDDLQTYTPLLVNKV